MTNASRNFETSDWERCTRDGFASWPHGRRDTAATYWLKARDAASVFADSDPRRAAAFNNAALALSMLGQINEAREHFETAQSVWIAALNALELFEPPLTGRGSVFHIRLAARHAKAFEDVHRQTLKTLLHGAQALTDYNLHMTTARDVQNLAVTALFSPWIAAVEKAFGVESAEAAAITLAARGPSLEHEPDQTGRRRFMFERWRDDQTTASQDLLAILAAAHLTAITPSSPAHEHGSASHQDPFQHRDTSECPPCQRHP